MQRNVLSIKKKEKNKRDCLESCKKFSKGFESFVHVERLSV